MDPTATELLAELRALESERLPSGGPRFLFAGSAGLDSALHALASEDEELARAAHAVCRRCKDVVCHVFEFAHDPLEALSFLACVGWPTPLVDLSASAEHAVASASGAVTVVDLAGLPAHVVSCDSAYLSHCGELAAPPRRWLERRGVSLTHAEWRNFDTAADFALVDEAGEGAIALRRFERTAPGPARVAPGDDAELREGLEAAIRKAGRKLLGSAGLDALETLIERVRPS